LKGTTPVVVMPESIWLIWLKMLKDLGCKDAINLDGGGSTGFIVNNRQTVKTRR